MKCWKRGKAKAEVRIEVKLKNLCRCNLLFEDGGWHLEK